MVCCCEHIYELEKKERQYANHVIDDSRTQHYTTPRRQNTYTFLHQRRHPTKRKSPTATSVRIPIECPRRLNARTSSPSTGTRGKRKVLQPLPEESCYTQAAWKRRESVHLTGIRGSASCRKDTTKRSGSMALSQCAETSPGFVISFLWTLHSSRHIVDLQCLSRPLCQQRSSLDQMSDVFSRAHDPITHAHKAR